MTFLVTLFLGSSLIYLNERNQVLQTQKAAMHVASSYAHLLQEQLNRSLSATYALAAVLRQGKGQIDHFDALAADMLHLYGGGISALQLARKGVISNIVPMAGNEGAFGHNLLADPSRNKEAFAAVETRKLTLAGPFPLRQGGIAVVGRLPVFLPDDSGFEQFWGFTTAVIKISDLLAASKISGISALGYDYELSRMHPDYHQPDVFARSSEAPLADPVSFALEVPNGRWTLSLRRSGGWNSAPEVFAIQAMLVVGVAVGAALLAYYILKQPYTLRRKVKARTLALSEANRGLAAELSERRQAEAALREKVTEMQAGLSALADGVIVLDGWGRIRQVNDAAARMLGMLGETPRGQALEQWLSITEEGGGRELPDLFRSAIRDGAPIHLRSAAFRTAAGRKFEAKLSIVPAPAGESTLVVVLVELSANLAGSASRVVQLA